MPLPWLKRCHNLCVATVGITSNLYNSTTNTYESKLCLRIVAFLANVLALVAVPYIFWDVVDRVDLMQWNPVMVIVNLLSCGIRLAATLYTVVYHYSLERANIGFMKKFRHLERIYLQHLPRAPFIQRRFHLLFYVKYTVMMVLILVSAINYISSDQRPLSWLTLFRLLLNMQNMAILLFSAFNFFWLLWLICQSLSYVHMELQELLLLLEALLQKGDRDVRQKQRLRHRVLFLIAEVEQMLEAAWRLAQLAVHLNRCYEFLLVALRLEKIASIIMMGYSGAIYTFDKRAHISLLIEGSIVYNAMFWDLYLLYLICEMTVTEFYKICALLRRTNECDCTELQQVCDRFALRVSSSPFYFDVCGLTQANLNLLFVFTAHIVYITLTFLQFHWIMNLHNIHE